MPHSCFARMGHPLALFGELTSRRFGHLQRNQSMYYIIDTNIWIDLSRGKLACKDLMGRKGVRVVLAPMVITELVRGIVKGSESQFLRNRSMIECMARNKPEILELPKIFMFGILWKVAGGSSDVRPDHYRILMDILIQSKSFADFLKKTEERDSAWKKLGHLNSIHENVLDKELRSLDTLADQASIKALPVNMARMFKLGGLLPDPDSFETTFSAAVEFLRSSVIQVKNGAKPRKNNRGMYVDSQLFWYLADPEAVVVSDEDFSTEIRHSPQRIRIISYETFSRL